MSTYNNVPRFYSSVYPIFLGTFLVLVNIANNLNFGSVSSQVSDLSPSIAPVSDVAAVELPDFSLEAPVENRIFTPAPYLPSSSSYISIAGKTIATYQAHNGLNDDAGSRVAKYNSVFYYGHNSNAVFGSLSSLPIGSTFTISENGSTKTYKIALGETFDRSKNQNGDILYHESEKAEGKNRNYSNGIYSASYKGKTYDLAIMTCAGQSLGNGDATQRYVVFAYEV